jgi:hypothetical protein
LFLSLHKSRSDSEPISNPQRQVKGIESTVKPAVESKQQESVVVA